jgi:hypothetical protein
VNRVPVWRIVVAVIVVAVLVLFAVIFTPIYAHNLELENFVSDVVGRPDVQSRSDDVVRSWVLDKAHQLDLPVRADEVKIGRSSGGMHIEVGYAVKVDLPGYTVNLHFHPGAGGR